jgi:hypothetical protein
MDAFQVSLFNTGEALQSSLHDIRFAADAFDEALSQPEFLLVRGGFDLVDRLAETFRRTSRELRALARQAQELNCPLVASYVLDVRDSVERALIRSARVTTELRELNLG